MGMEYKPLFLNPDDTVTLRILPPSSTSSLYTVHYRKGYDFASNRFDINIEGEWVFEDKKKEVKNRFSFLDLED